VEPIYGIDDLARLGGVSRRTVRYYVQEGLLPAPRGLGRGRHYGPEHLERLLRVKSLQQQGLTLEGVRAVLERRSPAPPPGGPRPVPRNALARLVLVPGVELLVSAERQLPSEDELRELAEWCRAHFRPAEED
jgi:DNA-binding transcriptional MerR regulator